MPVFTRMLVTSGGLLRKTWKGAKPKLLGIGFIAVVIGLVSLSVAFYNKDFTKVDMVTLKADRIGRQLDDHADVKIRGLIVGEVRSTSTTGVGADLHLAINPSDMKYIPTNVEARILPKTLFGEKYVDLVVPGNADHVLEAVTNHIQAGAVIPQDESTTAIELATVFDDLVPLLKAVQPAELSTTLNSVADALQGQGDNLGANLVRTDTYLKGLNPALPQLNADISKLADLADNLNNDAPAVFKLLDETAKESANLTKDHTQFLTFLGSLNNLSTELSSFLSSHEANLIELGNVAEPTLETLRTNSQELPYVFNALTKLTPRINQALGGDGPFLHITLTFVKDRGAYTLPTDCPFYESGGGSNSDKALGPNCPGYSKTASNGAVTVGSPTERGNKQSGQPQTSQQSLSIGTLDSGAIPAGYAGSMAEQQEIAALIAPSSGLPADQVPGFADLLFGPAMRGATVSQTQSVGS